MVINSEFRSMQDNRAQLAKYLVCPDDGSALSPGPAQFVCLQCARQFPVIAGNVLEILPTQPTSLGVSVAQQYVEGYIQKFSGRFGLPEKATPFGAQENMPAKWANRRRRQVRQVLPSLLKDTSGAVQSSTCHSAYVPHCCIVILGNSKFGRTRDRWGSTADPKLSLWSCVA